MSAAIKSVDLELQEVLEQQGEVCDEKKVIDYQPHWLASFGFGENNDISFSLIEYFKLVDWTGRTIRADKRGYIKADVLTIIERLELDEKCWLEWSQCFERKFARFAGKENVLRECAKSLGQSHCKGVG